MSDKSLIGKRKETYRSAVKKLKNYNDVQNQFRKLNSVIPPRKKRAGLTEQELKVMEAEYSKTINLLTQKLNQIEADMGGNIEARRQILQNLGNGGRQISVEKKRLNTYDYINKLRKTLSKDLKTINACIRTDAHPTVAQLYNSSRSDKIEMDISKATKYGGLLSTRYRVKNQKLDGFFTESKKGITQNKMVSQVISDVDEKYGEFSVIKRHDQDYVIDICEYMLGNPEARKDIFNRSDRSIKAAYNANERRKILDRMVKVLKDEADPKKNNPVLLDKETCDRYCDILGAIDTPEEFMSFIEFGSKIGAAKNLSNINRKVGINENSKADKRNSAVSMIADLLGCSGLIAKSVNLHVKDPSSGKIIMGTFMETAKGADCRGTNVEDMEKFNQLTPDKIEKSLSLKKDIANLQVVDWICGNPDRHTGNMMYKFDENGNLVGLIGIDNDTSLGDGDHSITLNGTFLENMTVVTKDMADHIEAMDKEALKTMLYGYDLKESEVKKAIQRFEMLKDKLAADKEYFADKPLGYVEKGRIRIVPDNELDQITIYGFLGQGNPVPKAEEGKKGVIIQRKQGRKTKNLFASVANFGVNATGLDYSIDNLEKSMDKDCVNVISENYEMGLRTAKMDTIEAITYKGSQEFRDMITSLKSSSEFVKNQGAVYTSVSDKGRLTIDQKSVDDAIKELNKSITACDNYLGTKNEAKIMKKSKNSVAYQRFKLAKDAKTALEKEVRLLSGLSEKAERANGYIDRKKEMKKTSKKQVDTIFKASRVKLREYVNTITSNEMNKGNQPENAPVVGGPQV